MNETIQLLLTRITRLEDQVSRLVSRESADSEGWTSWTPEFEGSGTAGVFTYTQQFGQYYRFDDLVFIIGRLLINTIPTPATGNLRIMGLPFSAPNSLNNPPVTFNANVNLSAGYSHLTGFFGVNTAQINVQESGDDVSQNYPAGSLAAGDTLRFSAFYRTAS
jgi:hypothetical protein